MNLEEQQRYHAVGADYFWLAGKRQLALRVLAQHSHGDAPSGSPRRVLDAGCGPGHDFQDLKPHGMLYGLDPSQAALQFCQQKYGPQVHLVCASGERLPFRHGSFNLIIMLDVLEHIEADEAALAECRQILKPGGRMLITVPAFQRLWGSHDDLYGHKRRYTADELRQKVLRAGLTIDHITYVEWLFTLPLWLTRSIKRRLPARYRGDDFVRVPRWLNVWLTRLITAEAAWVNTHTMPWGASIVCVAHAT